MEEERFDRVERLLAERGVRVGPLRVAVAGSGVAAGRPGGPVLHVSWPALVCLALLAALVRRRGR